MDGWKIRRAVDLQRDSPPIERLRAMATLSSRQAHCFLITVLDGDAPADLAGLKPWVSIILPGRASLQKQVGDVQANVVSVPLPQACYAERGDVSIVISLMDESGQTQIPLYGCVMRVMEDSTDTIIDEEKVIPSLAELLAQFDACKAAAGAANTAAGKAISAASAADVAAKAANTQASAAQEAAELAGKAAVNAQNAADQINGMTATAAGLNADEAPTANLVKAGDHYELELGIPQGRKGDTGATPKIKLSVVTGEPGTDAKVEQSGTPEEPLVKLTIPRGDTGSLGDLTICGKAPDQAGKVMLTAEDVGALSGTDETLTESGKAADAAATGEALSQLKSDIGEEWIPGTYPAGTYKIYENILYKSSVSTSAIPGANDDWIRCNLSYEMLAITNSINRIERIYDTNDAYPPKNETVGFYVIDYQSLNIPTPAWYFIVAFRAENTYITRIAIGMTEQASYIKYARTDNWVKIGG